MYSFYRIWTTFPFLDIELSMDGIKWESHDVNAFKKLYQHMSKVKGKTESPNTDISRSKVLLVTVTVKRLN